MTRQVPKIAAGVLVAYLLATIGNGTEAVLCVADGESIALEFGLGECCEATAARRPDGIEQPCECCVDIPISLPAAAPHTGAAPPRASVASLAPAGADACGPVASEPPLAGVLLAPPSLPPPLTVLRTVVLLL
jgi:hypothetical protein